MSKSNQELNVLLHLELQQSEKLKEEILQEFRDIEGVMDLYNDYQLKIEAGLLTRDPSLPFSQYVLAKGQGLGGDQMQQPAGVTSPTGGGGEGGMGGGATCKPPVVAPSLISTTALLAKLSQQDVLP